MPWSFRRVALIAATLSACAEAPTSGSDAFVPSVAVVSLVSGSDSVHLTATLNGAPYAFARLRLREESRGVPELPVVDESALARGIVRPAGPGTAVLEVSGGPGRLATVPVTVTIAEPTVFAAVTTDHGADADTTRLFGVHLAGLANDAVQLDGAPVTILARSATQLAIPAPAASASCTAASAAVALSVAGATVAPTARVTPAGAADIRLAVGAWRPLTQTETQCLRFDDAGAQEYVLAFADVGPVEAARESWSPPAFTPFTVRVADRTVSAALQRATAATRGLAAAAPSWERFDTATASSDAASIPVGGCSDVDFTNFAYLMWCRSTPWAVGDTMRLRRPHSAVSDTVRATVYAVHGFLVFAAIDGDTSTNLRRLRATIDSVLPLVTQQAVPFLRELLGPEDPTTSVGSGQMLTLIGDFQHGSVGGGCCYNNAVWSSVLLGSTLAGDRAETLHLLVHELVHTYQRQWMFRNTPEGGSLWYSGTLWGAEGGADLIAYEVLRRVAGVPWGANATVAQVGTSTGYARPMAQEAAASGVLTLGYSDASSFQRDLVARLVDRGRPLLDAYREVSRGSLEDWFGVEPFGAQRLGLAARMRAVMDADWEPSTAILLYLLSQGADDRVNSTVLRNPFWMDAWRDFGGDNRNLELRAGTGADVVANAALRMSGGVVRLVVSDGRAAVSLSSSEPDVRWAIARTR